MPYTTLESTSQRHTTLTVFLTSLFLLASISLWMVGPYLLAIIIGAVLAFILKPLFLRVKFQRNWPKSAAALVTIGIFLLLIVPVIIFTFLAVKQGIAIAVSLDENSSFSIRNFITQMDGWKIFDALGINSSQVVANGREWIRDIANAATGTAVYIATKLPKVILQAFLVSISCFFFLLHGEAFLEWIGERIPMDSDVSQKVIQAFKNMAVAAIWASLAAGGAQSAIAFLAFLSLNIPGAFLAGVAAFLFAWIPILGTSPVWIMGGIYLYSQGDIVKLIVLVALGLVSAIIDNAIRPLFLRGKSNMHPLVSLVAILGGVKMFGIAGVFLGPILAAVTISFLQVWPATAERFDLMVPNKPDENPSREFSNQAKSQRPISKGVLDRMKDAQTQKSEKPYPPPLKDPIHNLSAWESEGGSVN